MLATLGDEDRPATAGEQAVLARWSSWGSLPKVFDPDAGEFAEAREQLRARLDDRQWQAASRTTLNAHYTDFDVARSMWRAVEAAGFAGGRVLEPGVGSGTFLATAPEFVPVDAVGVEVDPVTAQVAQALHPGATIRSESFADTRYPDGWFDLAIGNVPFGDYKLFDPIDNRAGHSIHNHFIAKSLRLTRPGGYTAVLTSRFTLDAGSSAARRDIAELGDLVGAVRLPEGAMRRVAGTGVAMDLLVLRRREPGAFPAGEDWFDVATVATPDGPVKINQVFAAHPGWVLGELRSQHGQYGQADIEVRPLDGELGPRLDAALDGIVAGAWRAGLAMSPPTPGAATTMDAARPVADARRNDHHVERSILATDSGRFARIANGVAVAYSPPRPQAAELRALVDLRDTFFEVLDTQAGTDSDAAWEPARERLNGLYDRYVDRYGPLNRFTSTSTGRYDEDGNVIMARRGPPMGGFSKDPGFPVVRSLEIFDETTQSAAKATVFERRVLSPRHAVGRADSPEDAIALCLDELGAVNVDRIATLLDCPAAEARQRLGTLIYDDPAGGPPLPAASYLSGNVRARLDAARQAAVADGRWQGNVDALEAVQPRDLDPDEIEARLGAPWIPAADIEAFCAEVLDVDAAAQYAAVTGTWAVRINRGSTDTVALRSEWGTSRVHGLKLVESAANRSAPKVTDEGPDRQRIVNVAETLAAREKQEALMGRFSAWVWEDPDRSARLAADYNRRFNSTVIPAYDGSHLSLPGLAEDFTPHQHQLDAVWRILSEPSTLLAHSVGAGKTATMVIAGRELKRLGLVNKPAYVVPNHMLEQFSREYLQLYPAAKVLVADKDALGSANRVGFIARCTAEDWDAVILTQSAFKSIPVSEATQQRFLDARMGELRQAIAESEGDKKLTVKKLERALARLEERHTALIEGARRDEGGVAFENAGIDYIFYDEAHSAKNLAFPTRIDGAGPSKPSQLAEDVAMKVDYLRERHGHRVVTMATATPIANSLGEMWVMQRYLQPDTLRAAGMGHFDAWAANFAKTVTALELAPDGSNYRMHTRLARFTNIPDLLRMFGEVADVRTAADLGLPTPDVAGGKPETIVVPSSDELRAYVATLVERAEQIRNRSVRPEEDNMLKVTGDGRSAALDLRLVDIAPDPAGGKIAGAARRVAAIYHMNAGRAYLGAAGTPAELRGALQLVFCDLGTPGDRKDWSAYDELRSELVALGVPAAGVRFTHEAAGDDKKKGLLFAAARAGQVSVLMGSTPMMGVGTNVQARLVAIHHLDCPWRPADLEQRDGRGLRQGNQNDEVAIVRYVTEGSFDIYNWQTVERKAAFIDQVMGGRVTERSVDDVGDQALSYSEVKALATGNPLIMERAGIESELAKLSRLQAAHRNDQARLVQRVRTSERDAEDSQRLAGVYRSAAARAVDTSGDRFTIDIEGRSHKKRPEAGAALQKVMGDSMNRAHLTERRTIPFGELAGFTATVTVSRDATETTATLGLEGVPRHSAPLSRSEVRQSAPLGLLSRLENLAGELPERAAREDERAALARSEATKAAGRIGQPFEHTGRIESLRQRLAAIDGELTPADPAAAEAPERPAPGPEVVVRAQPVDNRAASRGRPPLDPAVSLAPHDAGHGAGVVHQVPTKDSPNRTGPVDMATFGDAATDIAYPNKVTGEPGRAPSPRDHPEPGAEHQSLPAEPSDELGG